MTTFSEADGRKVVDRSTAETAGKISDFVIDAANQRLAALVLKKTSGEGDTLPWSDVFAFGDDAVIVADASVVVARTDDLADLADKRHAARNKRVLTTLGVDLGPVKDVEFDPQTGGLLHLLLKDGTAVPATDLMAIGSYAVVVRAAPEPATSS